MNDLLAGLISIRDTVRLTEAGRKTVEKQLRRKGVPFVVNPDDTREHWYRPELVLAPSLLLRWSEEKKSPFEAPAKQTTEIVPVLAVSNSLQPVLPFDLSPSFDDRQQAVAAIPQKFREKVEQVLGMVADCTNGTYKKYVGQTVAGLLIRNNDDWRKALAKMHGVSASFVYQKLALFREVGKDWKAFSEALVPKPRPGRSGHTFFNQPENEWMLGKLRDFYLNQAQHSMRRAWEFLLAEIDAKQKAWGIGHIYDRPTPDQCRTALNKISKPVRVLARHGEKAFDDQCGQYVSRDPDTLHANDLWVTDQREVDVRLRDGGEHLGRIWMVSFLDVATDKVLGYGFGPILSSDMVMMAATMAISRYGVPAAVHMDLGKEFIGRAFNGTMRKLSGEVLTREVKGLWTLLGTRIVKAIGRNPKTKTDERWHREVTDKLDRCFPGYCGSNTDERPEKLKDEERQHLEWLAAKPGEDVPRTPLVTITQYIRAFIQWAEIDWNGGARGRGKMRKGMTPNEAWNVKRPADGLRTITDDELDHHSAEHRFVKIARGGEYTAAALRRFMDEHPWIPPDLPGHLYETAATREMDDLIAYCRKGRWATLYGPAGAQKSFLLEYRAVEAARDPEPSLVWIPIPGRMTPTAILRRIAMAVAAPYAQSADGLRQNIIYTVRARRSPLALALDEMDLMEKDVDTLEAVRRLGDLLRGKLGLIVAGNEQIVGLFKPRQGRYFEQWRSRIEQKEVRVLGPTREEARTMLTAELGGTESQMEGTLDACTVADPLNRKKYINARRMFFAIDNIRERREKRKTCQAA